MHNQGGFIGLPLTTLGQRGQWPAGWWPRAGRKLRGSLSRHVDKLCNCQLTMLCLVNVFLNVGSRSGLKLSTAVVVVGEWCCESSGAVSLSLVQV
jgi:hypothetical protein